MLQSCKTDCRNSLAGFIVCLNLGTRPSYFLESSWWCPRNKSNFSRFFWVCLREWLLQVRLRLFLHVSTVGVTSSDYERMRSGWLSGLNWSLEKKRWVKQSVVAIFFSVWCNFVWQTSWGKIVVELLIATHIAYWKGLHFQLLRWTYVMQNVSHHYS